MLGLGDNVCDSRTAVIKSNNKLIKGNVMEATGGKTILSLDGFRYADEAFAQHFALQVFDLICGQTDRHMANFHCIVKDGLVTSLKALDNDLAFGAVEYKEIKDGGYNRIRPLTDEAVIGLPEVVRTRIMGMQKEFLEQTLGDILNEEELDCLWKRFEGVKGYIRNIKANNNLIKAKWDNTEGKLVYEAAEDKDDRLRAIKMAARLKGRFEAGEFKFEVKGLDGKPRRLYLDDVCYFTSENLDLNMAGRIRGRREKWMREQYGQRNRKKK